MYIPLQVCSQHSCRKKVTVWLVVAAMSADFADGASKESDACFGATIPHDGSPGVMFHVWLGNQVAAHTIVLEGAGPGDVVYFD